MRKVKCPYCNEAYPARDLVFRCSTESGCDREPDAPLGQFRGLADPPEMPRIVPPAIRPFRGAPRSANCPQCRRRTFKLACPHCHNDIHRLLTVAHPIRICLIGDKGVGKTHYLVALLHLVRQHFATHFGLVFREMGDEMIDRYGQMAKQVFDDGNELQGNRPARIDWMARMPMLFALQRRYRRFWLFEGVETHVLAFYDIPGEDFGSTQRLMNDHPQLAFADGLVLLVDPTNIAQVRQLAGAAGGRVEDRSRRASEIASAVADTIRTYRGLPPDALVNVPVAVAFSKLDAVKGLLVGDPVLHETDHRGYFDLSDAEMVHKLLKIRFDIWLGKDFPETIHGSFRNYLYCAFSALGSQPRDGKIHGGVQTLRVQNPLLWLLAFNQILEARRGAAS